MLIAFTTSKMAFALVVITGDEVGTPTFVAYCWELLLIERCAEVGSVELQLLIITYAKP